MELRRSAVIVFLLVTVFVAAFTCLCYAADVEISEAQAATETSGKWQSNGQTVNLIPEILSTDTWDSLVAKGWGKDSGTPALEVYETDGYGYGVRPVDRGANADIGNDSAPYGGIYYTLVLSEADRVKANAGQLSISASASYYRQSTASVDLTLRAEFHRADNSDISTAEDISENGGSTPASLSLNQTEVPANTAYIEMWFSNSKSLLNRPWIAQMQAYLHDSTAPSAVSSALVENTDIADRGGAIAGDTVQYSITFNEKISVANPGTATIDVAGTSVASDSYAVTDNGGVSTLTYSFGIPEVANNGTIKFSGVSGATVKDEAGNNSDITYKDIPGTLNYYAETSVTVNCSGLTYSGATTAKLGTNATITLSPDRGYQLPTAVTVTIGGAQVTNSYSYNASNGQITVNGAYIKGDIVVTASGVAMTVTATFDKQSGEGGTDTVTATFDSAMPQISCPTRTGYTFRGYFSARNGGGTQYYDQSGNSVKNCDFDTATTLYAYWTANTYTVTYNSNKPAAASGQISGSTASSEHTYDSEKALTSNGYSLVGWTFAGWATSSTGTKAYKDNQSVENLTAASGGTVMLYAVWTANTYTVTYNYNKPATASGTVSGATENSSHTYDTDKALTANGYSLTGWTFTGWATSSGAAKAYDDSQSVKNLTATSGGTVTLYAVWTANTYTVTYNSNKPATASGTVGGATENSLHTYDTDKALTANGYGITGWTFTGWATSAEGEKEYDDKQSVSNITAANGGSVTLYAVWVANTYTITYNPNRPATASGAVSGLTSSSAHTYDIEKALTVNEYTLTGWTFTGWATTSSGTQAYDDSQSVKNLTATSGDTVTLYAVWTANTYTVTYNSNKPATASGTVSGSTAASSHTYDTDKALTANGYSLTGWTFTGWSTSAEEEKAYNDSQTVKNLTAASGGSVTLYAVWTANEYTLFYNSAGGTGAGSNLVYYDGALPELNIVPTRNGYNFSGYFDKADGEGTLYYDAEGRPAEAVKYLITGDLTVYAYWQPITYTVTLYSEGNYTGTLECTFGSLTLPSAEALSLTRNNYDFVGWNIYDEQNWSMYSADKEYKVGLTTEQGAEVTLYAAWLEKPVYLVGFDPSGGTGAPAMTSVHEGETVTLSEQKPYKENHTFVGWTTDAEGDAVYFPGGEFTMGDRACTLYAVWQKNPALSYNANGGEFYSDINVIYPASGETVTLTSIIPYRQGYVFVGWALDAQASAGECIDVLEMPGEDTVLYAVWEKQRFTVSVSVPEGYEVAGVTNGTEAEYGSEIVFTVTGANAVVFVNGIEIAASDGVYSCIVEGETEIRVSDGTEIFLLYSANGGSGAPVDTNSYLIGSTAYVARAENVVREGYAFLGWSSDKSAVTPTVFEGDTVEFTDGTLTLYAVWEANVYYVKYYSEGTLAETVGTFRYDEAGTLAADVFTKEGHTFVGWATEEGGETVYSDGATICNLTATDEGEISLYAVWKSTVTTVSFDLAGGTEGSESMAIAFGTAPETETVLPPVKKGYVFLGYFTAPEGGVRVFDENMNLVNSLTGYSLTAEERGSETPWLLNEENVTLYAVYSGVNYTVVYINGNDEAGRQSAVYGEAFELLSAATLQIAAPEYHSFAGWSVVPEGVVAYADGQRITNGLVETEGAEFYLYAVFAENEKMRVFYEGNGGMNAPVDNTYYYVNTEIAISSVIPEKEGYIFSGWGYDTESVAFAYADGAFTPATFSASEDVSLYAIWTAGELLQSQIDEIRVSTTEINAAIEALRTTDTDLSGQITALAERLTAAEDSMQSPDDTFATDAELAAAIGELKTALEAADTALQSAIDKVQTNLDNAVAELNASLTGEVGTLNEKLTALDSAYKAADTLINSDIAALKGVDTEIKASISALDTAYKAANTALQNAIDQVQTDLDNAVAELNASLTGEVGTLNEKLTALDTAYKAADTLINSDIAALREADTEIEASISALDTAYKAADTALQNAIDQVQTDLDNAVAELESSIAANETDIENKLSALDTAYKAADTLINSDIAALKEADTEIKASISALDTAYKAADVALQNAVDRVQTNLDNALAELRDADASNYEDLNAKLSNFENAYTEAELMLSGRISALATENEALARRVAALETLFDISSDISGDIVLLKEELAAAKEALEASDKGLRNDLTELDKVGDNRADAYLAVNIVLGVIVLALVGWLVIKPMIEKRRRKKGKTK